MPVTQKCQKCRKPFIDKDMGYVCHDCRVRAYPDNTVPEIDRGLIRLEPNDSYPVNNSSPSVTLGISPSDLGALNELLVAADMLRQGFHVYRSMSPSAPCDLVAFRKDSPCLRIEVKSGYRAHSGIRFTPVESNRYDTLAVVCDGVIYYHPELPER